MAPNGARQIAAQTFVIVSVVSCLCVALGSFESALAKQPRSSPIPLGDQVLPPLAYIEFCRRYHSECEIEPLLKPVKLTEDLWNTLVIVNDVVNGAIRSVPEPPGKDEWHLGAKEGDCDEFVAEKRHQLITAGFPANALSYTEVREPNGGGHLVLVALTESGAYVLDNMRRDVLPWRSTGYQFVKMSSPLASGEWLRIKPK